MPGHKARTTATLGRGVGVVVSRRPCGHRSALRAVALVTAAVLLLWHLPTIEGATHKFGFFHANKLFDGTFNEAIYRGAQQAVSEGLDVEVSFHHTPLAPSDPSTVITVVRNLTANYGYSHFVLMGFEFAGAATEAGNVAVWSSGLTSSLPGFDPYAIKFSLIDFSLATSFDNIQSVLFEDGQVSFLAGVLAGYVSTSKVVAVAGGIPYNPVRRFVNGFRMGVRHSCPDCAVEGGFLNEFDPGAWSVRAAYYYDSLGADVVFGPAGAAGQGVINVSATLGSYVIGIDADEYVTLFGSGTLPGASRILTSAMKALDVATAALIREDVTKPGNFRGGRSWVFDFTNSGLRLAPCHETCAVWSDQQTKLEDGELQIANGVLSTGIDATGVVRRTYGGPNHWVKLPSFGSPPRARKGHASPQVGDTWFDKSMYVMEGFSSDGISSTAWAYDLEGLSWRRLTAANSVIRQYANGTSSLDYPGLGQSTGAVMPAARVYHTVVQHDGGTMVLFGGLSQTGAAGRASYDDAWVLRKSEPTPGKEFDRFMLLSPRPTQPEGRFQHSALSLGTTMVMFGGRLSSGERVNDLWMHQLTGSHPDNHTWTQLLPVVTGATTSVPQGRAQAAFASIGSSMYLTGGQTLEGSVTVSAEVWSISIECISDQAKCTWAKLSGMPGARHSHIMVGHTLALPGAVSGSALLSNADVPNVLVVHGGTDSGGVVKDDVFVFNATSGAWSTHSSFGGPALAEHTALLYDGHIIMYGGLNASDELSADLWAYSFDVENLCELASLTGCSGHGTCGQDTGTAVCACATGYGGVACLQCAEGYLVGPSGICEELVTTRVDTDAGVYITVAVLATIQSILYLSMAVMFWRWRKEFAIKASSPPFCIFLCFCGIATCVTSFLLALPHDSVPQLCVLRAWLVTLSGTAVLAALFSRTYRLDRLFNNTSLKKFTIPDSFLWKVIVGNIGFATVLCTLWTIFDAPEVKTSLITVSAVSQREVLSCSESPLFEGIDFLYFFVLLVWGAQLAYKTRKLPSVFNESAFLGAALFVYVSISALSIPLLFLLDEAVNESAIIRALGTQVASFVALGLVLGSKLYIRIKKGADKAAAAAKAAVRKQTTDREEQGTLKKLRDANQKLRKANIKLGEENKRLKLELQAVRNELRAANSAAGQRRGATASARSHGHTGRAARSHGHRPASGARSGPSGRPVAGGGAIELQRRRNMDGTEDVWNPLVASAHDHGDTKA